MILKEKLVNLRQTTTTNKWMQEKHSGWSALSVFITEKYWCNQRCTLRLRQSCIDTKLNFMNSLTLHTLFDTVSLYQYQNITHCTTFQGNQLYIDCLGRREKLTFKAYLLDFFCIRWSIRSLRQMFRRGNVCLRSRDSHLLRKNIYKKANIYPKRIRLA